MRLPRFACKDTKSFRQMNTLHALFYKNLQPSYDLNDHDRF